MPRPTWEVADILRRYGAAYRARHPLPPYQLRIMKAIEQCRTAALGGHVEQCGHCLHQRISYNSCRNRHCPKCQNLARAQWLEQRQGELLPVEYFHVVFTIPEQLNALARQNKQAVYGILFAASAATLQHSLPPGFQRIRHYGLLASRNKSAHLALCRQLLETELSGILPSAAAIRATLAVLLEPVVRCPVCGLGAMVRIYEIAAASITYPANRIDSS